MSLKINGLSKRFGDRWVLRDVSFEVQRGQICGLVGPAGSGKSVLLSILAGKTSHNGGSITLNGSEIANTAAKTNVTFLTSSINRPSLASILSLGRSTRISDGENQSKRLDAALRAADSLLLLDGWLCAVDPQQREESFAALRAAVREKELTVLFASSDFEEALLYCDVVAVIQDGEVKQFGIPQEVYESPVSQAVARFTGRSNIIEARRLTSSKADMQEYQTTIGNHRLFARRAELSVLGPLNQNTGLAIRPEYVSISFGASFPEDNLLRAVVSDVRFLGPTTLVSLDAGGLLIEAIVLRLVGLDVGEECLVGLPPDRIQILSK